MLVLDKVRHDPHEPAAYGATVTYDLPLDDKARRRGPTSAVRQAIREPAEA